MVVLIAELVAHLVVVLVVVLVAHLVVVGLVMTLILKVNPEGSNNSTNHVFLRYAYRNFQVHQ
jgi:flagellar basal body-associated protein FliL